MKTSTLAVIVALLAYSFSQFSAKAFYSPEEQRWLNRDPLGDLASLAGKRGIESSMDTLERNLFSFVQNAPLSHFDPDGRNPIIIIGGVFALYCVGLITYATHDAKKNLKNGECINWKPRCINLISSLTGIGQPITFQFCKDCNGNFTANMINLFYTGPGSTIIVEPPKT